jgi:nicotinamide mononucleotide adenylyltransferase
MSGIKYLLDIYEKKGKGFIEKLFNKNLTVTENLDGSSFSFEKDFTGDNISFYKKDQDNPITKVDRILMKYYEKPIIYIDSLPEEVKSELPKGWRFGMAYFPNRKPVNIEYDRLPKNNLILTHVTVRDEFGDVIRNLQDKKELDIWAEKLGVEGAPIIFQGKLSRDQKISMMEFLSTPLMDLKSKFKTESFTKYLISILNPDLDKTFLGNDLKGSVDSIVFRFEDEEGEESILAKMVDPIFYEINRERKAKKTSYFPSDIYSLCLIDVMNFILETGVENFYAEGNDPETRYINFIFDVFKRFIENEGDRYIGADFEKPEYLKSEGFQINTELIDDQGVITLIEEDEVYIDILQMILNSFRKFKRKPHGFFTEGLIQQFNMLVEEIASYINAKKKEIVEESVGLPTFVRFKKTGRKFVPTLNEEEETPELEEEEEYSDYYDNILFESKEEDQNKIEDTSEFFTFKDFKKVVSTNKEKKKIKILKENNEKVNMIIGKFQPFNNGHLKMCSRLKKENNLPVFLCVVHPGGDSSKKYPFTDDLIKKSIGALTSENPELFAGYQIVPSDLLEDALSAVVDKANPVSVCIGESDFQNMVLQREWIRNKYDLEGGDIEIFKTPQWANNDDVRSYIKQGDFQGFKNKVPKSIAVLFNEFTKQLKGS